MISSEEMKNPNNNPELGLFSHTDDFINLSEVVRDFPKINETEIKLLKNSIEELKASNSNPLAN